MNLEVVTASRQPEKLSDTVATVYVITAADLRAMGARTIYDALLHLPGVNYVTNVLGANHLFFTGRWRGIFGPTGDDA